MTSYARLGKSPYLIGFMLAALMVWSLSAITRAMDGALQTTVELRIPVAAVGTAIQDSAITLRRRVLPPAGVISAVQGESPRNSDVARPTVRPLRQITPPLVVALTPVTAPQVTAIASLLTSASVEPKNKKGRLKKKAGSLTSADISAAVGPPLSDASGSRSGKGSSGKAWHKANSRSPHR